MEYHNKNKTIKIHYIHILSSSILFFPLTALLEEQRRPVVKISGEEEKWKLKDLIFLWWA
jgi:hypothetical protein